MKANFLNCCAVCIGLLISSLDELSLAQQAGDSENVRLQKLQELDRRAKAQRAVLSRYRTPSTALAGMRVIQEVFVEAQRNLEHQLRMNPADTNLVEQLEILSLDRDLQIAVQEESTIRLYERFTATNALVEVRDLELRSMLLSTTNLIKGADRKLLEQISTPEAKATRRQFLTTNWERLVHISTPETLANIADLRPTGGSLGPPKPDPDTTPSAGEPILGEFKLPKPD